MEESRASEEHMKETIFVLEEEKGRLERELETVSWDMKRIYGELEKTMEQSRVKVGYELEEMSSKCEVHKQKAEEAEESLAILKGQMRVLEEAEERK